MPPSSADAYTSLQNFNNSRRSVQDVNTEAENKYDIPGYTGRLSNLRGLVSNLTSSVNAVDPSVTGRTSGSFVTEGQRSALVNKERTPILGQLSSQQDALGQETQGYNTASSLADKLASSIMQQDQTKYQSLLDQYNAAVAQEAEKRRQAEADRAYNESVRQFNEQQAAAAKAGGGAGGYGLGGSAGGGTGGPAMQNRGGGFNFQDASGKAISAAKYASLTGANLNNLLLQMGQAGDKYAAEAYYSLQKAKTPAATANIRKNYSALFW